MHTLQLRLTNPDWRVIDGRDGKLHWIGRPDTPEELLTAIESSDVTATARVGGHWSAVYEHRGARTGELSIVQDMMRSYPVFYSHVGQPAITDDIELARELAGRPQRSDAAAQEFLNLGFVTGRDTLFSGIFQAQMGERVDLSGEGVLGSAFARLFRHEVPGVSDEGQLDELFDRALDVTIERALSWIGDRQIVLPLSGGLDSRLLAVELHERGINNVLDFTYGVGETREVGLSRAVAEGLGQHWEFVQYGTDEIAAAWASPEAGEFITSTYCGASLPHIQDWLAIVRLRERGLLDKDAVFLPGHTIVGAMHDDWLLDQDTPVDRDALLGVILHHHASIRPGGDELRSNPGFIRKVDQFLDLMGYDGSPAARLDALECYNMFERQTKYINHSMRGYEHFGYAWALPMLDVEVYDAWMALDVSVARDREWYRRYVNRRYARATGQELRTFEPFAAATMSNSTRDRIKRLLRAVGLLERVELGIKARAIATHPMGFQAYVGDTTAQQLRRFILRGGEPMGIYTERFLADSWNPYTHIFDH